MIRLLNLPVHLVHQAIQQSRKLWVRVVLFGALSLVGLVVARLGAVFLPARLTGSVDIAAVDRMFGLISSSMLAVTTFSLAVMVSVYRATSTQWTPRIHRLMLEDRTTQNTLATFIGAYVYATVGIVLRETGVLTDAHAFLIFYLTVAVLAVIVVYIIRWTLHLQSFGSLIDTARELEKITTKRLVERVALPCLGGRPLTDVPQGTQEILAEVTGYVQYIYVDQLQKQAEAARETVYVAVDVGSFVVAGDVVAHVSGTVKDSGKFSDAIVLGDLRSFEQDPRFGLLVLGEMASKALSPGINDAGTAIDVMTRLTKILSHFEDEAACGSDAKYDRVYVRPMRAAELIGSGFAALARDGAAIVEVHIRLQEAMKSLRRHGDQGLQDAALAFAKLEFRRALDAIPFEGDRARLLSKVDPEVQQT
tara:strand:- start:4234 stop:5496 length:1263 start_codon:yes stop_codon:yes gene_type:complete